MVFDSERNERPRLMGPHCCRRLHAGDPQAGNIRCGQLLLSQAMSAIRIAVLPDFREEGWISMDYCADRLLAQLPNAVRIKPGYRRFATRISNHRLAVNYDRFRNRFKTYPAFLKTLPPYDRYHV